MYMNNSKNTDFFIEFQLNTRILKDISETNIIFGITKANMVNPLNGNVVPITINSFKISEKSHDYTLMVYLNGCGETIENLLDEEYEMDFHFLIKVDGVLCKYKIMSYEKRLHAWDCLDIFVETTNDEFYNHMFKEVCFVPLDEKGRIIKDEVMYHSRLNSNIYNDSVNRYIRTRYYKLSIDSSKGEHDYKRYSLMLKTSLKFEMLAENAVKFDVYIFGHHQYSLDKFRYAINNDWYEVDIPNAGTMLLGTLTKTCDGWTFEEKQGVPLMGATHLADILWMLYYPRHNFFNGWYFYDPTRDTNPYMTLPYYDEIFPPKIIQKITNT